MYIGPYLLSGVIGSLFIIDIFATKACSANRDLNKKRIMIYFRKNELHFQVHEISEKWSCILLNS